MNNAGKLFRLFIFGKAKVFNNILKFHSNTNFKQILPPENYISNSNIESSLWFTSLPSRKRRARKLLDKKKAKVIKGPIPAGELIIKCKNKSFNQYTGHRYGKFDVIPLASKGWHHKKSAGDFFSILPISEHPAFLLPGSEKEPYTFKDIGLSEEIVKQLKKMGIYHPTTIQIKTIQKVLKGKNVLITAETGCGKTLAYLAPIVQHVKELKAQVPLKTNAPFALVLVPTRELAIQIGMVANKMCSDLGIRCLTLLGGRGNQLLLNPIMEQVDILVCTLGVIRKMLIHGIYTFDLCKFVVLDEADTLLDDSFNEYLKRFLCRTKMKFLEPGSSESSYNCAQICLVSATKPTSLDSILADVIPVRFYVSLFTIIVATLIGSPDKFNIGRVFLNIPRYWNQRGLPRDAMIVKMSIPSFLQPQSVVSDDPVLVITREHLDEISTSYLHRIQPHIPQHFLRVKKSEKPQHLLQFVKSNVTRHRPTMIFSNKTATCIWVNAFLKENGVKSISVNAEMKAEQRLKQYQAFREGYVDVISCTDLISRGLDCTTVKHVINYEFPRFMADYIHRCGRTGRLGHVKGCEVTNLVSSVAELRLVQEIEKAVRCHIELPQVNNNITRIIQHRIERMSSQKNTNLGLS